MLPVLKKVKKVLRAMKTKVQVNSKGVARTRTMLEIGLEEAIYRAFPLLLPDLWASGYRIISQQAVLLGRRLDLLLQTDDGRTCIILAKRGEPAMPRVRDQALDYADCWTQSYPALARPRLIVIGNQIPDATKLELANFGVESRTIITQAVSAALQLCQPDRPGTKGLKLIPARFHQDQTSSRQGRCSPRPLGLALTAALESHQDFFWRW